MDTTAQPSKTLRSDARFVVNTCAGGYLRVAARRTSVFLDRHLAPAGLTAAQFGLMALVAAVSDDTLGALAQRAGMDQSTLSRNLEVLARLGWVEIAMVERDRRKRAVWLTEAGARKLEAAMPLWRAAQQTLSRVLDAGLAKALGTAALSPALDRA